MVRLVEHQHPDGLQVGYRARVARLEAPGKGRDHPDRHGPPVGRSGPHAPDLGPEPRAEALGGLAREVRPVREPEGRGPDAPDHLGPDLGLPGPRGALDQDSTPLDRHVSPRDLVRPQLDACERDPERRQRGVRVLERNAGPDSVGDPFREPGRERAGRRDETSGTIPAAALVGARVARARHFGGQGLARRGPGLWRSLESGPRAPHADDAVHRCVLSAHWQKEGAPR